ncbi:hypothetical protein CAPTEDRAFT_222271 [Capitella teleta]|uniref:Uncharacterized protein n=1 Tax=Capitella teleta TaxID=283909 RepID=R7TTZ9_CAPTE|nr:hypothetical protein CAPTEDRAFT_222271 [Capitella teleta]|eukprot:ELT97154.1 hypothetical protein CAPTEDRAFT_222271 [Capitella teleta]
MGRTKKVKEDPWKQKVQDLFASVQSAPEDTRQALLNSIQGEMNKLIGSPLSTKDELTKSSPSRPVRNRTPSVRLKDSEVGYSIKTEPKDDWSKVKEDSKVKGKRGGRKANISDQEDSFAEIDVNAFRPVVVNVDPDLMGETDDQIAYNVCCRVLEGNVIIQNICVFTVGTHIRQHLANFIALVFC